MRERGALVLIHLVGVNLENVSDLDVLPGYVLQLNLRLLVFWNYFIRKI